jgi:DNA-binding XRE family transcriptional regulator
MVLLYCAGRCAFGRSGAQRLFGSARICLKNEEKYFFGWGFLVFRRCAFGANFAQQLTYGARDGAVWVGEWGVAAVGEHLGWGAWLVGVVSKVVRRRGKVGGLGTSEKRRDGPLYPLRASIARELIRRRRAAGLTQTELAERAGVEQATISRIESGKQTVTEKVMAKIERALESQRKTAAYRKAATRSSRR